MGSDIVVGTIVLRPQPFVDRVQVHPRTNAWTITSGGRSGNRTDNRDELPGQILSKLAQHGLDRWRPDRLGEKR